jgi:tetratricopeptide (TPR) repeat protein
MTRLPVLAFKIFMTVINMFLTGENVKNIKSMCLVEYANYLHDKKDIDDAINYYKRALRLNSNNYYAYWGVTAGLMEKGLFNQAIDSCNKAISIKSTTRLFILQSVIYNALGETNLAEEALQKTVKYFDKKMDVAYDALAYTCYFLNMLDAAENYAKEALAINPNEAGLHYNLAKIYLKKHQNQMAKEEFQKVLQLPSMDQKKVKRFREYAKKEIDKISNDKYHPSNG